MPQPTILVVDDNATNLELLRLLLETGGMLARGVRTAGEAIEIARATPPDLILMDVAMPGMDGLTATRMLKADARTRDIPVVAVTSHARGQDEEEARSAGCDGYITKPVEPRDLRQSGRRLLHSQPPAVIRAVQRAGGRSGRRSTGNDHAAVLVEAGPRRASKVLTRAMKRFLIPPFAAMAMHEAKQSTAMPPTASALSHSNASAFDVKPQMAVKANRSARNENTISSRDALRSSRCRWTGSSRRRVIHSSFVDTWSSSVSRRYAARRTSSIGITESRDRRHHCATGAGQGATAYSMTESAGAMKTAR